MKKILTYSFITFLFLGFALSIAPKTTYAVLPGVVPGTVNLGMQAAKAGASVAETAVAAANCASDPAGCVVTVMEKIGNFILMGFSWILWLSGVILNFTVKHLVVDMKDAIDRMPAIRVGWKVFRDLANMCFIFLLLYIAFGNMLGLFQWRKMLFNIIIAALLINFSLFFTKLVIDGSNILAIGFYNGILTAPKLQSATTIGAQASAYDRGLSNVFMNALSLTTIYRVDSRGNVIQGQEGVASGLATGWSFILLTVAGSILMLIAAFIFFAAAILLMGRFVYLVLLMIFAPLAFLAFAIPGQGGRFSDWMKKLTNQAFFAPIYFAITWVVVLIISNPGFKTFMGVKPTDTFTDVIKNGAANSLGVFVNFFVVIFLLGAAIASASKAGAVGSKWAEKSFEKLKTSIRGGITGAIGRGTVGWAAKGLGKGYDLAEAKLKNSNSLLAKGIRGVGTTARIAANIGTLGAAGGMISAVNRGVRGTLEQGEKAKFGGGYSYGEFKEMQKKRKVELAKVYKTSEAKGAIKAAIDENLPATDDKVIAMQQTINKMSAKDVASMDSKLVANKHVAQALSVQQFEAFMNSEEKSEADKDRLFTARFSEKLKNYSDPALTPDERKKLVKDFTIEELERFDPKVMADEKFVELLSTRQVEDIVKSKKFTPVQVKAVRDIRLKPFNDAFDAGDSNLIRFALTKMNAEQIAKLDPDKLTDDKVWPILTPQMIRKIPDENIALASELGEKIRNAVPKGSHPSYKYVNTGQAQYLFK